MLDYTTEPTLDELQAGDDQLVPEMPDLTPTQREVYDRLREINFSSEDALEYVLDYVPADQPKFEIRDLSSANWVVRKLAECDDDEAEIKRMIDAEIAAVQDRAKRILAPIEKKRAFFTTAYGEQLEAWAKQKLDGAKSRSVKLIHGAIGFRKSPDKKVVDDEDSAVSWALELRPEAVKMSLLVSKLRPVDMESLEKFGAAHVEPGEDKFYIKPEMPILNDPFEDSL